MLDTIETRKASDHETLLTDAKSPGQQVARGSRGHSSSVGIHSIPNLLTGHSNIKTNGVSPWRRRSGGCATHARTIRS